MTLNRRSSLQSIQTLDPIVEVEEVQVPAIPRKSSRRRSEINGHSSGPLPPQPVYTIVSEPDRTPSISQKESGSQICEKELLTRRGGWRRAACIAIALSAVAAGLAVGLIFGLRARRGAGDNTTSPSPMATPVFPAGSFSFMTALTTVSADCTTNPSTWRCYPYHTHAEDPGPASVATFFWIITQSESESGSDPNYVISSSSNPFAPSFSSIPLTHLDKNQYTERFTFRLDMNKTSAAGEPLSGVTATCEFPDTELEATIWTRKPPSLNVSMPDFAARFGSWPGEVEIAQRTTGTGPPRCVDLDGRNVGAVGAGPGECLCRYANFGLD